MKNQIKQFFAFSTFVLLTLSVQPNVQAGWVTEGDVDGEPAGQTCTVNASIDNLEELGSLRAKVESGYNAQNETSTKFCSKKILITRNVKLDSPLVIDNDTDTDGLIIEGTGNNPIINVSGVNGCAITINSNKITLKNLTIANGNGTGLCINSNDNVVENVIFEDNQNGAEINGNNNTVRSSYFRDNNGTGLAINSQGSNEATKNNYYRNGGNQATANLITPNSDLTPSINSVAKQGNDWVLNITMPVNLQRIEVYLTNPATSNGPTFVTSFDSSEFDTENTIIARINAQAPNSVFVLGFLNQETSAISNVMNLSINNTSGGSGTQSDCAAGPIEPGTPLDTGHVPNQVAPYPPNQDTDCDGIVDNLEDRDNDGILDDDETDPENSDSDGDGLTDFQEVGNDGVYDEGIGKDTNPREEDTDGDTIPDGVEDKNHNGQKNSNESDPTNPDTDGDGLPDQIEDANGNGQWDQGEETKAFAKDTDLDTLEDGQEDANHNGVLDFGESDPTKPDTDDDGRADKVDACPNDPDPNCQTPCIPGQIPPLTQDTDFDQMPDAEEDINHDCVVQPTETDWRLHDTDGDGKSDRTDPCPRNSDLTCEKACTTGVAIPQSYDADGDGIPNVLEDVDGNCIRNGGESDAFKFDTDNDGLDDGVEKSIGSDPNNPDSDNDQLLDGEEDFNKNGIKDPLETDPSNPDTDGDGINDLQDACPNSSNLECKKECAGQNTPPKKDSDADGIPDILEDKDKDCFKDADETNPYADDSDGDGIPDGVEDSNGNGEVDPGETDPRLSDSDGDNILDAQEDYNKNGFVDPGETDPTRADSDGDGVNDNQDSCPINPDLSCDSQCVPGIPPSNPFQDSDGDGLLDTVEDSNGDCKVQSQLETDPGNSDTDGDGIPDGVEDKNQNGQVDPGETNPKNIDSDGDGIADGVEDANHNGITDFGECSAILADTDSDGIPDHLEINTKCYLVDSDLDGISDGEEDVNKNGICDAGETCADKSDSDGDGASDGQEVSNGTNPLIAKSGDFNKASGKGGCELNPASQTGLSLSYVMILLVLSLAFIRLRRSHS